MLTRLGPTSARPKTVTLATSTHATPFCVQALNRIFRSNEYDGIEDEIAKLPAQRQSGSVSTSALPRDQRAC